jgi:hypothetical protein
MKKIAALAGIALGAFGISMVAADYVGPPGSAPSCPTGYAGCDAPLNIGTGYQNKAGKLSLGTENTYSPTSLRPLLDVNGSGIFTSLGITGSLIVGGNATTTTLAITGGSPTAGKVLTAVDSTGKVSWQSPGSATSGYDSMCNFVSTKGGSLAQPSSYVARTDAYKLSMMIGTKNICEDADGCTYRAWEYDDTHPEGENFYGTSPVAFKQDPTTKRWIDGNTNDGSDRGINGDGTPLEFLSWDGLHVYDDKPAESTYPSVGWPSADNSNELMLVDNTPSRAFTFSICD